MFFKEINKVVGLVWVYKDLFMLWHTVPVQQKLCFVRILFWESLNRFLKKIELH